MSQRHRNDATERIKSDNDFIEYSQCQEYFASKHPEEIVKDVRGILKKPILNRTQEDIHFLYFYFQKLEFFNEILETYDKWTVLSCLKLLSLVSFMPNQIIFQRDEIPKHFWVLLSGDAVVTDKSSLIDRERVFKVGESAGNFEDQMMQFTLKAVLKCEFAVLKKDQYEFIVQKRDENEFKRVLKLLKNTAMFEDFQIVILKKNINCFEKKIYNYNSIVYDENQPIDGIYIIDSGQFSVMKSKIIDKNKQGKDQELASNKVFVRVSILQQQSQVFGQEEIFRAKQTRKNRVICSQNNSKAFFLSFENYMNIFKSTSDKTIDNLIKKEKFSQQMRDGIIQRRSNLDQQYKNFLYQSSLAASSQNQSTGLKHYDSQSIAELQQLQVPSTKKAYYLPSINQFPEKRSPSISPEKNELLQEYVLNLKDSQKMNKNDKQQQYTESTNKKLNFNSQHIKVQNQSNIPQNLQQSNNNNSPKEIINNQSKLTKKEDQVQVNSNNSNFKILENEQIDKQSTNKQIFLKQQQNISGKTDNKQQNQEESNCFFIEENEILEIYQKQKMENIQQILEKNKYLCQNANFLKDEDVFQELQRNKSNNYTLNTIFNRNRSISSKRQSIFDKNEGKTPQSASNRKKNLYDVDSEGIDKQYIQRSSKIQKIPLSSFRLKDSSNSTNNSAIIETKRQEQEEDSPLLQQKSFLLTLPNIEQQNSIINKDQNIQIQIDNQEEPKINDFINQEQSQNKSKTTNQDRRRSLRQQLAQDQIIKRQQNQSFHNIYDSSENRNNHLSYKQQLSRLNKSEEVILNQPNINQIKEQTKQNLLKNFGLVDQRYALAQFKDPNYVGKASRQVSITQIYEDVSPEKIKNLNIDSLEFQLSNQSELMRQAEHEIQYAINGPKVKLVENYIHKYIKRSNKRKIKEGYEIPNLLETLKKDSSIVMSNSVEILNEQISNTIANSNVNFPDQIILPQLNYNNSNFKQLMLVVQPQNSINKQFLRKSRKKIKEKLQKAIEDKILEDPYLIKKSASPAQNNQKNSNNNRSKIQILQNPLNSPKSVKTTAKLHKVILGIDNFDILKD
ncbi:cyclic nucleotide-binding domain protein (macronuclear) [Tetrahymena thermophila SB210]|uniref:Cyclic nucleotide-binding domain protein n=1 Tax=Tetrahymena thermophila (strain SB210) TaxID=312017 RepID=Q23AE2_TETTS|nr:cyclic nucleotide-binding domain protein [Tetrahymena thermophila SB210]EAR93550.1 cyclic nucleotide-binding domain protein [Tetrahymena thermophila SB210]|eukprot:XP_001013795.1 cyclic nucleotide-binding domain protein [Tetrahymena thermophila SB210]